MLSDASPVKQRLLYFLVGAASGAVWFLIPLSFDSGWGLPHGVFGRLAALACSILTGLFISLVFVHPFRFTSLVAFFALPIITVPIAITLFSLFLWVARLALGEHFVPHPAGGDFRLILESYIFYGLFGFLSPVLYGLALLTQWIMRTMLQRTI